MKSYCANTIQDLLDEVFPDAWAKALCGNPGDVWECRETLYDATVTLETKEIGCY
jgi:hypothetical protein